MNTFGHCSALQWLTIGNSKSCFKDCMIDIPFQPSSELFCCNEARRLSNCNSCRNSIWQIDHCMFPLVCRTASAVHLQNANLMRSKCVREKVTAAEDSPSTFREIPLKHAKSQLRERTTIRCHSVLLGCDSVHQWRRPVHAYS